MEIKGEQFTEVTITYFGDPSVGIFSGSYKMFMDKQLVEENSGKEDRQWLRQSIVNLYRELLDDSVTVYFDDECPDCFRIKKSCVCRCINCGTLLLEHDNTKCAHIETP